MGTVAPTPYCLAIPSWCSEGERDGGKLIFETNIKRDGGAAGEWEEVEGDEAEAALAKLPLKEDGEAAKKGKGKKR